MTRYYYTDPLAAAWMAEYFGMRFIGDEGQDLDLADGCGFWRGGTYYFYDNEKLIYIHPDSVHLLEPQEGDLLWVATPEGLAAEFHQSPSPYGGNQEVIETIQRNGKAFHWPEQETQPKEQEE